MFDPNFEFPDDSPEKELIRRLIETGLTEDNALMLLSFYFV